MRVFFYCFDTFNEPSGGIRQLYRMIDLLNANGFDAWVLYPEEGFRVDWFENTTQIEWTGNMTLSKDDVLILPEIMYKPPEVEGWLSARKIVYVQGGCLLFDGFDRNLNLIKKFYEQIVEGVVTSSGHAFDIISSFFPVANLHRVYYSFDKPPFAYCGEKQRRICYMPRKNGELLSRILDLLSMSGISEIWDLCPIENMSETEVSEVLKSSAIFLCLSENEGFGMPPAEAMACGCVVVGFGGFGGREFLLSEHSCLIDDGDYLSLAACVKELTEGSFDDLIKMGKKASDFILAKYSSEREVQSIVGSFKSILHGEDYSVTSGDVIKKRFVSGILPLMNPSRLDFPYKLVLESWSELCDEIVIVVPYHDPDLSEIMSLVELFKDRCPIKVQGINRPLEVLLFQTFGLFFTDNPDWVVYLDGDHLISPTNSCKLRAVIDGASDDTDIITFNRVFLNYDATAIFKTAEMEESFYPHDGYRAECPYIVNPKRRMFLSPFDAITVKDSWIHFEGVVSLQEGNWGRAYTTNQLRYNSAEFNIVCSDVDVEHLTWSVNVEFAKMKAEHPNAMGGGVGWEAIVQGHGKYDVSYPVLEQARETYRKKLRELEVISD